DAAIKQLLSEASHEIAVGARAVALDFRQSTLEAFFQQTGSFRLTIDDAEEVPAFLAALSQLFRRGLHEDFEATLLGQDCIAHAHGQRIREVVLAVLVHGNPPQQRMSRSGICKPGENDTSFARRCHAAGVAGSNWTVEFWQDFRPLLGASATMHPLLLFD